MTSTQPTEQHRWLQRLLGEWTWQSEPVPGTQHFLMGGTETYAAIGALWVQGTSVGVHGTNVTTLGFDPRTGRFVGTFVGEGMAHLWLYDAERVEDGSRLALRSVGPSFSGDGTLANYIDEMEFVSPDERVLRASVEGPPGTWKPFMTLRYRRAK